MSTVNEEAGITVFNGTGQKIEVLFQEEVQLDIDVPLFYIKSGEEEIQAYVNNHAKPELDGYTEAKKQEIAAKSAEDIETAKKQIDGYVTGTANPAVQKYADEEVKPQLEVLVSAASASAAAALNSQNQASASVSAADSSAQSAKDSVEQVQGIVSEFDADVAEKTQAFNNNAAEKQTQVDAGAETARRWAVGTLEEQPAGSSEYWAGEAKTAAENADNGYELFQASWFDHKPESVSWLRADTFSWQDGGVYFAAYNELSDQYADETSAEATDTVGDIAITYKRTPKGYKICAPDQADTIAALYENTGVAWYYILDTENTRFKLPRTRWGFVGCRNNVGNYVPESLPNIRGTFYSRALLEGGKEAFVDGNNPYGAAMAHTSVNNQMHFNASRSSSAYQDEAPVQQRAIEMYLYFFAGNAVKSDTIIDTGQITEALNNKLDIDLDNLPVSGKSKIASLAAPGTRFISNIFGNSIKGAVTREITAPATGVIFIQFTAGNSNSVLFFELNKVRVVTRSFSTQMSFDCLSFYIKRGDKLKVLGQNADTNVDISWSYFFYAEGENE